MADYTSNLKTWGAAGSEYPDGYSYLEGEQPVDEWDNFLSDNLISDVKDHLIPLTNNRIESDYGSDTGHPTSPEDGHQYWETTNDQVEVYDSTAAAWKDLAWGADLRAHENTGSGNPHSVTLEDARADNNVLSGAVDFSGFNVSGLGTLRFADADANGEEWRVTEGGTSGDLRLGTYDSTNGFSEHVGITDVGDMSLAGALTVGGNTTFATGTTLNMNDTVLQGNNGNTIDFGGASGHITIDADVRIADHIHWESDRGAYFGGTHNFSVRYASLGDELLIKDEESNTRVASFPKSSPAILDNGLHSNKEAKIHSGIIQGHNPEGTITETTSPKSWNFSGSEHRDFHTSTDVTISNSSGTQATEDVTVELYDGTDTTGNLIDSETKSVNVANGATSVVTFIAVDHNLDNSNYHIEITTSGTALAVDQTDEHTKGAQYTLGQDSTGNLEVTEEDGSLLLELDSETLAFDFQNQPSFAGDSLATKPWATSTFVDAAGDSMSGVLDMAQNQVEQFVLDKRTSDPTSPSVGQMWYRSDLD